MKNIRKGFCLGVSFLLAFSLFGTRGFAAVPEVSEPPATGLSFDGGGIPDDTTGDAVEIVSVTPISSEPVPVEALAAHSAPPSGPITTDASAQAAYSLPTGTGNPEEDPDPARGKITGDLSPMGEEDFAAMGPTARVSGPNLMIYALKAYGTQPFPYNDYTNLEFKIANTGSVTMTDIYVQFFVDGTVYGAYSYGNLNPGYVLTVTFPVIGICGASTVRFDAGSDSMTEVDMSDNSVSGAYTWEDAIDLAVYSIESKQGDTFESCRHDDVDFAQIDPDLSDVFRYFSVWVANYGNVPTLNVPVQFLENGVSKFTHIEPGGIGAFTLLELQVQIRVRKACPEWRLGALIDPDQIFDDAKRSNNGNSKVFSVTYDTERFAGHFQGASAMTVQITPASWATLTRTLSQSEITSAIHAWNGISSNVSIGEISPGESGADLGYSVYIVNATLPEGKIARTTCYKIVDGVEVEMGIDTPTWLQDIGPYIHAKIAIDSLKLDLLTKEEQMAMLTHELGHVLGLKHTYCDDMSVMKSDLQSSLFALTPQPHDRYNIVQIYGE